MNIPSPDEEVRALLSHAQGLYERENGELTKDYLDAQLAAEEAAERAGWVVTIDGVEPPEREMARDDGRGLER